MFGCAAPEYNPIYHLKRMYFEMRMLFRCRKLISFWSRNSKTTRCTTSLYKYFKYFIQLQIENVLFRSAPMSL